MAVDRLHLGELVDDVVRQIIGVVDRGVLIQIGQHGIERVIGIGEMHAGHIAIRRVFEMRQLGGLGVGRAVLRQHVTGAAVDAAIVRIGVLVDRDEQVGVMLLGDPHAARQRDEAIAVAREHRMNARRRLQLGIERLGNTEHDSLFHQAATRTRSRIMPTVARIDHHHHGPGFGRGAIQRLGRVVIARIGRRANGRRLVPGGRRTLARR